MFPAKIRARPGSETRSGSGVCRQVTGKWTIPITKSGKAKNGNNPVYGITSHKMKGWAHCWCPIQGVLSPGELLIMGPPTEHGQASPNLEK